MGKSQIIITIILFNIFFIAFITAIIIFIKQYKLKKKEHDMIIFNQKQEHQKELLSTQIEIQSQTMQQIGREIHDNIGQKLTLASLYTQQLSFENKAPQINENIENISVIINESLTELRKLSKSLTDDSINSNSIITLLDDECKKINELKKCAVEFETNCQHLEVSYEIKTVMYRITQEFIQNSLKYSNCKIINVILTKIKNTVTLTLKDDGIGFDISKTNGIGIGLKNMRKRAKIIKGKYQIESSNNGTIVTLEIPI
jgi:signal transduction histidine kinase